MKQIKRSLDPNNILNPGKMGFEDAITDILDENTFQRCFNEPEKIGHFSDGVDNEIIACIQCGFCRAGCPTFAESTLESSNAKGRVTLAFNMLLGNIEPSEDLAKRLYQCMLCLNCKAMCPAQVNVSDIVRSARARITSGLSSRKRRCSPSARSTSPAGRPNRLSRRKRRFSATSARHCARSLSAEIDTLGERR